MPKMKKYHERVKELLAGGVNYNFNFPWKQTPIYLSKTENSRVWDMDGKEYLDLSAHFGAMILGHGNREYSEILRGTVDRVLNVERCDLEVEALEALQKYIPSAEMIRFGVSGTETVQDAIRIARAYTNKNKFVRFENHYHGSSDNILGGKSDENGRPYEYENDFRGTKGRAKGILEEQSFLIKWNDIDSLNALFMEYGNEIAAVIMEPVCISAGCIMPVEGYLYKVRKLCDTYNIVLIFDEISTGFRMGLGGAQATFGITPDLTILAKTIGGGGVPISAIVGKKEIMQLISDRTVVQAGSFNGYPLGIAGIKATINILGRDGGAVYQQMSTTAIKIYDKFLKIAQKANFPLVIQGPTLCSAFHCCETMIVRAEDYMPEIQAKNMILNGALQRNGILVANISNIYPNITLSSQDVLWFEERAEKAIDETKEIINMEKL